MWNKPWKMKEGFAIGIGLIALGVVLQLAVGPVAWSAFAWPVNGVVMLAFVAIIALIYALRKRVYAMLFLGTNYAAIPAMALAVVLTIVMGLTIQSAEGTWFNNMLSFWPFVLIYMLIALILGQVIIGRALHFKWKRDIPFMLNHLGLFLAMTTATLGNADVQRLRMITTEGLPEWRAVADNGMVKTMPMSIELKKFMMETYDDGSPKRFASAIKIVEKSGREMEATIDVNKPIVVDGWKIYQYGYDTSMGAESKISILELVSDPWLPLVYAGIFMMLGGAVCMFIFGKKRK
ncbi:cytochrome c biogenesis protein ResB [Xylanibacter ruminicola]|nr:cytochrome c biogenesis protein ResB [Xylanibacter ruminicola]